LPAVDRFDVFLGYDTYVPEASWFPVVCEIENRGPLFSGVIEVSGGAYSDKTRRLLPIELPTGTTKRVTLPVFCQGGPGLGWSVRLLDPKGSVKAEQPNLRARKQVKLESVLLGCISRNGVWTPPLQVLKLRQDEMAPVVARMLPALLPDNPVVLSGLDALYLNSERVIDLREAQQDAVDRWIRAGGHLIVGVESVSDVNSSAWLRTLVRARLNGVTTIQAHPELQRWIRSSLACDPSDPTVMSTADTWVAEPTEDRPFADQQDDRAFEAASLQVAVSELQGGQVLVASGGMPLIIQAAHGLGRVTVLMFSPEREPFKSWKSLPALWSRLTGVPPRWYVSTDHPNYSRWASDGLFGAMIDSRQIRKLPVGWLLLLLLAYLVVIGPFDRWWLRKLGKPMLTWITFPLYVVLFSALIYFIGYKLRAGEREWNELHVVDVVPGGARAELRGRTYGSLYSPVNDTYPLRAPQKLAAFRGEAANAWGGGSAERLEVIQEADTFESHAYVPVWTSQLFVNDWWMPGTAPFSVSLVDLQDTVVCALNNRGQQALGPVRLVWRGRVFELGDLAPGQSRQHRLLASQGIPLPEFIARCGGAHLPNIVSGRGQAFGDSSSGRIDNLPDGCFVASFLGAVEAPNEYSALFAPPGTDLTPALRDNAVVLAWAEGQAVPPPLNQFKATRGTVDTLWRVVVRLNAKR
jgi:hypothetical protein